MAEEILYERKDFKPLGPNWVAKFLSRYDDLKIRFSQPLDKERAGCYQSRNRIALVRSRG